MKKFVLAVLTAGVFMMSSCTRSDSDLVLETQSAKKESTEKLACTMNWQTKSGTKLGLGSWNLDFTSVGSGAGGKVIVSNGSSTTLNFLVPGSASGNYPVLAGQAITIDDVYLTSSYTVTINAPYGSLIWKYFTVKVGYCV